MEIDEKCEDNHFEQAQSGNKTHSPTADTNVLQSLQQQDGEKNDNNKKKIKSNSSATTKSSYDLDKPCEAQELNLKSRKGMHNISSNNTMPISKHKQSNNSSNSKTLLKSDKLKDLIVLQLDLIEHQQIKIFHKDKQIISLQNEKDQLEARLSRMERRISVQKRHSLELTASHDDVLTSKQKSLLTPLKSPVTTVPTPPNKKVGLIIDNNTDKNLIPVTVTSCNDKDFWFENFLRTNVSYLDQPFNRPLDVENNKPSKHVEKIPVPPWTLVDGKSKEHNSKDTPDEDELHEDISNSAYEKRHSKPEQEEKRRKRWDLQQARQQRQHEMLIQKYNERQQKGIIQTIQGQGLLKDGVTSMPPSSSEIPMVDTIYKESDHIMAVEVSELVPVCAFGYPVPSLPPRELELPWFSIAKREIQLRAARNKHIAKSRKRLKGPNPVGRRRR